MSWRKRLYLTHRWIGLLVSVQLLAWSTGGFMFSILDIDNVHGDWERNLAQPQSLRVEEMQVTPLDAIAAANRAGISPSQVMSVRIHNRMGGVVYELLDREGLPLATVDTDSGEVILRISQQQACEIALADFKPRATVKSVSLLEGKPPLEYRGKPMPVYQVLLNHSKETHIYISPITGEVIARRNKPWRIFDFFWMLHIMDYGQRENFNHWLLSTMSILAILTSMTGLALWLLRLPLRLRPRLLKRRVAVQH